MRDYDPTTGRYNQADPLGLVDGASVYGYALQNPGRYVDPRGEANMQGLPGSGVIQNNSSYPITIYDTDMKMSDTLDPGETSGSENDWDFIIDGCTCKKAFSYSTIEDASNGIGVQVQSYTNKFGVEKLPIPSQLRWIKPIDPKFDCGIGWSPGPNWTPNYSPVLNNLHPDGPWNDLE